MKIWKLVSGILSAVFFMVVAFQSCAVGVVNALEDNDADTSGGAGMVVALLMLVSGIVSACVWKSNRRGADIALIILYGFTALIGFCNLGTFVDLEVWSWWCAICASLACISLILPHNDKEKTTNETE